LGQQGEVIDQRLYAAGIVLAGQDWIRQRCGAGIAISSAFKVIESIRE
jgi:glycerol-3-phosphate dehydrogenase subunit B